MLLGAGHDLLCEVVIIIILTEANTKILIQTAFDSREYPCDHYTSVINVTLLMTGSPRTLVHTTALQLLQILDKRFFGTIGPLQSGLKDGEKIGTLDVILSNAYCRSQMYLSKQLAQMRPELTMPMFSEITHRFQTARSDARTLLVQCLLPWLENVELVATSVPPAVPLSYIMVSVGVITITCEITWSVDLFAVLPRHWQSGQEGGIWIHRGH